jgi:hypothetical protein
MKTANTDCTNIESKYKPYVYINFNIYQRHIDKLYTRLHGLIDAREDRRVYGDDDDFELLDDIILGIKRGIWRSEDMYKSGELKIVSDEQCAGKEFWIDMHQYYTDQVTTCRQEIKKIKALFKDGQTDADIELIEEGIEKQHRKIRWMNNQLNDVAVQVNNTNILQSRKKKIEDKIAWLRGLDNEQ